MAEMRRLLGMLRTDDEDLGAGAAAGHGAPRRARRARPHRGRAGRVARRGRRPRRFRRASTSRPTAIVQEALTNVAQARGAGERRSPCRALRAGDARARGRRRRARARAPADGERPRPHRHARARRALRRRARDRRPAPEAATSVRARLPLGGAVSDPRRRSPTTRRSCGRASARSSTASPTSRWSGEAADGVEAVELARARAARRRAHGHPDAAPRRHRGDPPHRRAGAERAPGPRCSPRTGSTSTCSRRCAPVRAASSSRTHRRRTSSPACGPIAAGDALLDPSVTRSVIDEFVRRSPRRPPTRRQLDELTEREREVLVLLTRGPLERRDRRDPRRQRRHRQDPRRPRADEARRAGPGPGRDLRLRSRRRATRGRAEHLKSPGPPQRRPGWLRLCDCDAPFRPCDSHLPGGLLGLQAHQPDAVGVPLVEREVVRATVRRVELGAVTEVGAPQDAGRAEAGRVRDRR